jgi:mRNA-degrading endonuclease HigB of HigAB toxin-antitoxin module
MAATDYTKPWKMIKDYFPGKSNRTLRDLIFNLEFDGNDCRIVLSTIGFTSPELAKIKLEEIHQAFQEIKNA